jgi:hypothetical protein
MTPQIDDRTVAYVVLSQPIFEDLRQVAAQLAGLLVLSATGAKTAAPDHPMLTSAAELFGRAADGVHRVQSSVTERARPHHDGLRGATAALRDALAATRVELGKPATDLDTALVPLRHGYACLQRASEALPGFQMVSFDQGCCSVNTPRSVRL